jgi:hypothetical protein
MNLLHLKTGPYRLAKCVKNPCPNKRRPYDWRCQREFPQNFVYVVQVSHGATVTAEDGSTDTEHRTIQVNAERRGSLRFALIIESQHGKKPKIVSTSIPKGCVRVPLTFLSALTHDHSVEGALLMMRQFGFDFGSDSSFEAILCKLVELGKVSVADIYEAAMDLDPTWHMWPVLFPPKKAKSKKAKKP